MHLISQRVGFPEIQYPRGPQWQSTEERIPFVPFIRRTMPSHGTVDRAAAKYENILGWAQQRTPIWSNWMPGLGDGLDLGLPSPKEIISGIEQKGQKLENALTAILVLSGIAAGASVINLMRR